MNCDKTKNIRQVAGEDHHCILVNSKTMVALIMTFPIRLGQNQENLAFPIRPEL